MGRIYEDHLGETLHRNKPFAQEEVPEETWTIEPPEEETYAAEGWAEGETAKWKAPGGADTSWTGSLAASIRSGALEAPVGSAAWREGNRSVSNTDTMPHLDIPTEQYSWEQVEAELENQIGYRRSGGSEEYTRQVLRSDDYGTGDLPRGELVRDLVGEEDAEEYPGGDTALYQAGVVSDMTLPAPQTGQPARGNEGAGEDKKKSPAREKEKEKELTPQQKLEIKKDRHTRNLINRTLFFLAATAVIVLQIWHAAGPDRERSEKENRMLAGKPAITREGLASGSYFSSLESYFADQFPGRDAWIALNLAVDKALGRHESKEIYFGEEGYLIARPDPVNRAVVSEKTAAINRFHSIFPDLSMTVAIIPEAAHILKDRLPKNAETADFPGALAEVGAGFAEGISCPNVYPVLASHSGEYIYYKTDHHWTSLGGFYVYQSIRELLGIAQERSFRRMPVSTTFQGTLASQTGEHGASDTVEIFVPEGDDIHYYVNFTDTQTKRDTIYTSEALEQSDHYTVFFGGNYPQVEIRSTNMNGKNLLVFKDSYANSFVQLLVHDYEKIILIDPRYYYNDIQSLIGAENITDVLFLYCADTFFTDTTLNDVLLSVEELSEFSSMAEGMEIEAAVPEGEGQ